MGDFGDFCERIELRVEPFQRRIVKGIAGPEREFVALLPRGQGKTTLLAAIALHHLTTVEGAQVYCAASSRDQARILSSQPPGSPASSTTITSPRATLNSAGARTPMSQRCSAATCEFWLPTRCDCADRRTTSRSWTRPAACASRRRGSTGRCAAMLKRPSLEAGRDLDRWCWCRQSARSPPCSHAFSAEGRWSRRGHRRARRTDGSSNGRSPKTQTSTTRRSSSANPASWITVDGLTRTARSGARSRLPPLPLQPVDEREGHWLPQAHGGHASANPSSNPAQTSGSASTSAANAARPPSSG